MKKKANMKSIHLRKKSLIDFIRTFKKLNKNKDIPSRQVKSTQKDKAAKAYQFMLDIASTFSWHFSLILIFFNFIKH